MDVLRFEDLVYELGDATRPTVVSGAVPENGVLVIRGLVTLRSLIAREVGEAVGRLLRQGGLEWPGGLEPLVEQPARIEHGDYTINVALQLARHLR
ncbi:MAG: hypothetical protein GX496_02350, partial [Firmicutes bacterium]|nr:hypothetical protein [Bacillota bacterium]